MEPRAQREWRLSAAVQPIRQIRVSVIWIPVR